MKLGHRPGLDAVRGAAVLMVMSAHCFRFTEWGWAGSVGVWLFFALSGFLITRLLLEERERTERIDRRAFYIRRVRRLLPAIPAALALMVGVNSVLGVSSTAGVVGTLTYSANFLDVGRWLGAFAGMWSLAIEEQFYLAWPLVLTVLARRSLLRVAAMGAVLVWLARWHLAPSRDAAYLQTWFRADALLAGAALAALPSIPRPKPATIAAAAGVLLLFSFQSMSADLLGWGGGPATLACVVLVAGAVHSRMRVRFLEHAGRLSYGLYLFHGPIALLFTERGVAGWITLLVTVPAAAILAHASWMVVESRFVRSSADADDRRVRHVV